MILKTHDDQEIEYSESDLLEFPNGLFGFPDLRYYLPLSLCESGEDDNGSILLLQSTEEIEVSFAVINPIVLCPDYTPELRPEELSFLAAKDSGEISYYVVCVVRDNYLENMVNLKCPLAINSETRIGMQVVLDNTAYGYRHKLCSFSRFANSVTPEEGDMEIADSKT